MDNHQSPGDPFDPINADHLNATVTPEDQRQYALQLLRAVCLVHDFLLSQTVEERTANPAYHIGGFDAMDEILACVEVAPGELLGLTAAASVDQMSPDFTRILLAVTEDAPALRVLTPAESAAILDRLENQIPRTTEDLLNYLKNDSTNGYDPSWNDDFFDRNPPI